MDDVSRGYFERLIRWRDIGDGPISYTAGDSVFAGDVAALLAETAALRERLARAEAERDQARAVTVFFSSVIKSGEPWTETCEREYRAALAALTTPAPGADDAE